MTVLRRPTVGAAAGRAPVLLVVPAGVATLLLVVPLLGLVRRAPWTDLLDKLSASGVVDALQLSLVTATTTTLVCLVLGVPLAWVLARTALPGRRLLRALVTVPLVMPPVVGGVALITAFSRTGIVGGWVYETTGWTIQFTTAAVVLAQTFVALPFLVLSVEGALRSSDARFEDVAVTLGASRWETFARVTLPLAGPGIASGLVLAWARALGEFGATITFAGNVPGVTQTLPPQIYRSLQSDFDGAVVISLLLLATSVAILVGLRERWLAGVVR